MAADDNDPVDMASYMAQQAMYGNEQAQYTGLRAAYGDRPYFGAGIGAYQGASNVLSDVGQMIRPMAYAPPMRVNAGYYGQAMQVTTFTGGLFGQFGFNEVPRGVYASDYRRREISDFQERIGGGIAGLGIMGAGLGGAALLSMGTGFGAAGMLGRAAGGLVFGGGGAAIGGAAMGFLGVPMLGAAVANGVLDQYNERRELNNYLETSSFRYVGAGSAMADPRTGAGMNMEARRQATQVLRQADFTDPTMDRNDLRMVLAEGTRLGLMSGSTDIEGFQKKFNDLKEGVKSVTKVFQTTLEDGLKIIKDFKTIGIDAGQVRQIAAQTSAIGMATGRTASEVMGLGMQGAEMFRGTGVNMAIGYQANIMNLSAIRASRDARLLSQEAINQAGGEEALAQAMTVSGLQYMQSAQGRGSLAAYAQSGVGSITADLMNPNRTLQSHALRALENVDTPAKLMRVQANQDVMLNQMTGEQQKNLQMADIIANARFMRSIVGEDQLSAGDALKNAALQANMPLQVFQAELARMQNAQGQYTANMAGALSQSRKDQYESVEQNLLLYRFGDVIKDTVARELDVFAQPFDLATDRLRAFGVEAFDETIQGIVTTHTGGVDFLGAAADVGTPKVVRSGPTNIDVGADFLGMIGTSAGERVKNAFTSQIAKDLGIGGLRTGTARAGANDVILDEFMGGAFGSYVSREDLKKAIDETRVFTRGTAEAAKNDQAKEVKDRNGRVIDSSTIRGFSNLTSESNVNQIAYQVFGVKRAADLTQNQWDALLNNAKGTKIEGTLTRTREEALAFASAESALATGDNQRFLEDIASAESEIGRLQSQGGRQINYKMDSETLQLINRARGASSRGDKEGRQRLLAEATELQAQKSKDYTYEQVQSHVETLATSSDFSAAFQRLGQGVAGVARTNIELGTSRIQDALAHELRSTKLETDQVRKINDQVKGVLADSSKLLKFGADLTEDEKEVLSTTKVGASIFAQQKRAEDLKEIDAQVGKTVDRATNPAGSAKEFERLMRESPIFKNDQTMIGRLTAAYSRGGVGTAIEQMQSQFRAEPAGATQTSAPSLGLRGQEATSDVEILRQQVALMMEMRTSIEGLNRMNGW